MIGSFSDHTHTFVVAAARMIAFWSACASVGAVGAQAQSGAGCPGHKALTLAQVLAYVEKKTPDQLAIQRIDACRVSFPLDVHALNRLVTAGASKNVVDALNKATASQFTLEEARSQVAELERHIEEIEAAAAPQRDAALRKLEAEYRTRRERAAHTDPKSDFESTADYNARIQRNEDALAAMDRKYGADRNDLAAEYANNAKDKEQPYRMRIAFLKDSGYPDSRAIAYDHYSADNGQLTAVLGGEVYQFDNVAPMTAEALAKNWSKVRMTQPFSDDEFHTRVLVLAAAGISTPGYSRKLKQDTAIKSELEKAQASTGSNDDVGAMNHYLRVLEIDPGNQAAKDGIAAVQVLQQRQSAAIEQHRAAGEWVDPQTQLMWTLNDNGNDINWKAAGEYCKTLRNGGFSDWRLPSIGELKSVYDPKSSRNTAPTGRLIRWNEHGKFMSLPAGTFWEYHIRGGITLTNTMLWSNTVDKSGGYNGIRGFSYTRGEEFRMGEGEKMLFRVLCVRP